MGRANQWLTVLVCAGCVAGSSRDTGSEGLITGIGDDGDADDDGVGGTTGAGGSASGSSDAGTDGTGPAADESTGGAKNPIPPGAEFVDAGAPSGGHPIITDLAVFRDRLYLTTSRNPLGDFGAAVFSTTGDGSFSPLLNDSASQGFLRLRVIDDVLYIPDGDPNGYDPSFVYISADGMNVEQTLVVGAVHTFDVAGHAGDLLASNGMASGAGSLCLRGASTWDEVVNTPYSRLRYMLATDDALLVGKSAVGSSADYLRFSVGVQQGSPDAVDAVPGEAVTFRWYAADDGRIYWSSAVSGGGPQSRVSDDGTSWSPISSLAGEFVSDFAELGGHLYALSSAGLWESSDGAEFDLVVPAPGGGVFDAVSAGQGINVDGMASLAAYHGQLWAGSSRNGSVYRIE